MKIETTVMSILTVLWGCEYAYFLNRWTLWTITEREDYGVDMGFFCIEDEI